MARRRARRRPGPVRPILRLAGVVALGTLARGRVHDADEAARASIAYRRSETLDRTMPALTDLGSTYALAGAGTVLWALGRRRLARDVACAGALAWGVAQAAKPLFARARPYEVANVDILVRRPAGLSFPSGHPAVAAAVAGVLDPEIRGPGRGLVARMPRLVAFSRVYVGVHYPTDVIGGMLLGRAVADLWLRYAARDADVAPATVSASGPRARGRVRRRLRPGA